MKNLLVEYEGGGYDGCFWQYNYFMFDENGRFVNLFSTGYKGIDNEDQARRVIADYVAYIKAQKDRDNDEYGYHRHYKSERTTIVNLNNPHSILQWTNNTNGGNLQMLVDKDELLREKLICNCYECGETYPVWAMYLDPNDCQSRDLYCEFCNISDFWEDEEE